MTALVIVVLALAALAVIGTLFLLLVIFFVGSDIDPAKFWMLLGFDALLYLAAVAIATVINNPMVIALLAGQG
jgi:hypothetical protein